MKRAELKVARAHPLGPGAVDADRQLGRGVGLVGDLNGPRGDPDLLFLGQAQDIAAAGPVNHVPERNPAAVALNDLADEVSRQAADRLAVALPEPDPVGKATLAKLDQRPDLERQALRAAPGQLGVEQVPAVLALRRRELLP